MTKTLDEFLSVRMSPQAKLISLFLATRAPRKFTHADVAAATCIHPADVEQAAITLMRGKDETPLHPIVVGLPSCFEMPADHPLRDALEDLGGDPDELPADAELGAEGGTDGFVADGETLPPAPKPLTKKQKKAAAKAAAAKKAAELGAEGGTDG